MTSGAENYESLISFEYRFNQNLKQHHEELTNRKQLMLEFTKKYVKEAPKTTALESVTLYPVERAGKSGSEVFYLDVKIQGVDYPRRYIAKFQDIRKTEKEHAAAFRAHLAQMSNSVEKYELPGKELGMLICDLARIGNHIEFRNFFLGSASTEQCESALVSAFKFVGKNPNPTAEERHKFYHDYKRYVERSAKPLDRLRAMQGDQLNSSGLQVLAQEILKSHDKIIKKFNFEVVPYLVHGDLHARNLMVNSEDPTRTELIDFGWVDYGHPAKDFVLMEATLKFMLLHELLAGLTKRHRTSLHLPVAIYEKFEDFLCSHGLELPDISQFDSFLNKLEGLHELQKHALTRVYTCLKVVRSAASALLKDYCDKHMQGEHKSVDRHYFGSLFLVVLGLSCMSEMEPIWTLLGLEKMGARIWSS